MIRKILIFGPQGSGKGTQAEMISKKLGLVYISTGNILRGKQEKNAPLTKKINGYLASGELVPDEIINTIFAQELTKREVLEKGFVLEGYPRNKNQMLALEIITDITDVIVIDISDKEAIFRLCGRYACVCGKTYHAIFNPPKKKGVCDSCEKFLDKRDDDTLQAIEKRLRIYHDQTEPLIMEYEKRGIVRRVNGEETIPHIHKEILRVLGVL